MCVRIQAPQQTPARTLSTSPLCTIAVATSRVPATPPSSSSSHSSADSGVSASSAWGVRPG
jgi:hypothetical protein